MKKRYSGRGAQTKSFAHGNSIKVRTGAKSQKEYLSPYTVGKTSRATNAKAYDNFKRGNPDIRRTERIKTGKYSSDG